MAIPFVVDDGRACHVARLPKPDPVVGTQCLGCDRVTRQGPAVWPAASAVLISSRAGAAHEYRWECLHRVHEVTIPADAGVDKTDVLGGVDSPSHSHQGVPA